MFRHGEMKASQLGKAVSLSHVTIGNYLMGKPPKSEHLVRIALFFKTSTDWLLGLKGESMFDEKGGIREDMGAFLLKDEPPPPDPKKTIAKLKRQVENLKTQISGIELTLGELEK